MGIITRIDTPWGSSQTVENLAEGAILVSTAGHGGIMLLEDQLKTLPENIQDAGDRYGKWTCYEEDCAYGLVMESRPDLYRQHIRNEIAAWTKTCSQPYPPEYAKEGPEIIAKLEAKLALSDADLSATFVESNRYWYSELFGLGPRCDTCGQLNCKGHKNDLVVLAAWGSWHEDVPKGMVGVVACYGGRLRNGQYAGEEMYHLVPDAEYEARRGFFVVNPSVHPEWETKLNTKTKRIA